MPIYAYECPQCNEAWEELRSSHDDAPTCGACGYSKPRRVIQQVGLATIGQKNSEQMDKRELYMAKRHVRDIEKAAKNGTLLDYKKGKTTSAEFTPHFDRTQY